MFELVLHLKEVKDADKKVVLDLSGLHIAGFLFFSSALLPSERRQMTRNEGYDVKSHEILAPGLTRKGSYGSESY